MVSLNGRLSLALLVVFILTLVPLPEFIHAFRPPWVLLLVLYVQLFIPNYFNISLLFCIGLCLDVLLSTPMGEHVFALMLSTWFAAGKARRFQFFSMIQQMLWISLFCFVYQLALYLIDAFLGYNAHVWGVAVIVFLSFLIWPFFVLLLYPEEPPARARFRS